MDNKKNLSDRFSCFKCGEPGFKTDGECNVWCEKCLNKAIKGNPRIKEDLPKRNDKCNCGSNRKYKQCCLITKNNN